MNTNTNHRVVAILSMRFPRFVALAALASVACLPRFATSETVVDFQRDIRPLLSDQCFACHGPDENHREADLRLDEDPEILIDRKIVVPHDLDASELWQRVTSDDADLRMPPSDGHKALSDEQLSLIKNWIQQGATWNQHWAFVSPTRPAEPTVERSEWVRNTVDRFTLARIEQAGLQPSPTADAATLLRRLHLDLTGLPPTLEQQRTWQAADIANNEPDYEALVDQLLASQHFGERMALAWLDQSRYADTNGYSIDGGRHMWLWRDWVIDAYNRNMPFDQFLTEQLAGDLLPNATPDQRVATGFNRNHMITHEGGTIPEENLVNYVADRVKTTGEVFLGLTLGCAQCHDHKFDPISQRDYYRFFAYFNTIDDRGLDGDAGRNATPKLQATSVFGRDEASLDALRKQLSDYEQHLLVGLPSQVEWEQTARRSLRMRGTDLQVHPLKVLKVTSPNRRGADYTVRADGTVFAGGSSGRSPSISAKLNPDSLGNKPVTALRLVFTPHEEFPQHGVGHGNDKGLPGSFLLTAFLASATNVPSDQVDLFRQLDWVRATASASHVDFPPNDSLDPRDQNGWSPHPNNQTSQQITFELTEPLVAEQSPFVTVMMVFGGGPFGGGARLTAGQYRLYALTGTNDETDLPSDITQILPIPAEGRTPDQAERIRQYHASIADEYAAVRYKVANLRERIEFLSQPHEVMVMNEAAKPRATHVLNRGQYDQPLDRVEPGTPQRIGVFSTATVARVAPETAANVNATTSALSEFPPNRLGLARWMVHPQHPLTARVAVNRLWQQLFSEGIVRSSADFGSQGTPPTHPQLLDHLAVEFVESGWDVKSLIKSIVMSATYRQSSHVTERLQLQDPGNRLLARGPRFRLPAELIRDNALAIAGILNSQVGGPSVRPYQPPNLWKEISHFGSTPATSQTFWQDHGDRLYRRSLYTYWKRTSPPPSMLAFDAPNREICTMQRSITNTPLQALVMLNDPQFVEASRLFARRVLASGGATDKARLQFAFRLATSRMPSGAELSVLQNSLRRERARFKATPSAASDLLSIGEWAPDPGMDAIEQAAWTSVASIILNLSETLTKG